MNSTRACKHVEQIYAHVSSVTMRLVLASAATTAKRSGKVKIKRKGEYVYGTGPCLAALQAGRRRVYGVYYQDGFECKQSDKHGRVWEKIKKRLIGRDQLVRVDKQSLDRAVGNRPHQGVIVDAEPLRSKLLEESSLDCTVVQEPNVPPLWLALYQVQDPMNLGAILRCAFYFRVDRVLTSANKSCALSPVVSKASAGALEMTTIHSVSNMAPFLKAAVSYGWDVLGSVGSDDINNRPVVSCYDYIPNRPTILVLGNEGHGLSREVLSACSSLITIHPLRTLPLGFDSLNVSVATGVLLSCLQRNKTAQ